MGERKGWKNWFDIIFRRRRDTGGGIGVNDADLSGSVYTSAGLLCFLVINSKMSSPTNLACFSICALLTFGYLFTKLVKYPLFICGDIEMFHL